MVCCMLMEEYDEKYFLKNSNISSFLWKSLPFRIGLTNSIIYYFLSLVFLFSISFLLI